MYIERIQIEGGFLDGLDVGFTSGLNVVIGARGTGKTSLIELIRFCLNVSGSSDQQKRSLEHALSVLGGGQVTITLHDNQQKIFVTRSSDDIIPRSSDDFEKPLIFSQTEIETTGLEASSRVRLIDSFLSAEMHEGLQEKYYISEIRSVMAEMEEIGKDLDELEVALKDLPIVSEEIQKLVLAENTLSETSGILKDKTSKLQNLTEILSQYSIEETKEQLVKEELAHWYNLIKPASEYKVETRELSPESLKNVDVKLAEAKKSLEITLENVRQAWQFFDNKLNTINKEKIVIEDQARGLRQEVEVIQTGAGNLMRRLQEAKNHQAKLMSLNDYVSKRRSQVLSLVEKRNKILDDLELFRQEKFNARLKVVNKLNEALQPTISTTLIQNGQQAAFGATLADMLRGVGLKFGDVARTLSESISPRTLLEAVENFDVDFIADISNISKDRAVRVLTQLKSADLSTLATFRLDDDVELQLLDGIDYKNVGELSTGQRCTVILPIVLTHEQKVLIVDQPEDHIDNAFIANTLIRSIRSRKNGGQIIFTTHNPNIPVLGNADTVLHLGSDGKHGFVETVGSLNNVNVVEAITTVMEGGEIAFKLRAEFYGKYLND